MRVAGEATGVVPQGTDATRPSGDPGGGFCALLALLQSGAMPGIDGTSGVVTVDEPAGDDDASAPAGEGGETLAADGIVVTLSAAATATAASSAVTGAEPGAASASGAATVAANAAKTTNAATSVASAALVAPASAAAAQIVSPGDVAENSATTATDPSAASDASDAAKAVAAERGTDVTRAHTPTTLQIAERAAPAAARGVAEAATDGAQGGAAAEGTGDVPAQAADARPGRVASTSAPGGDASATQDSAADARAVTGRAHDGRGAADAREDAQHGAHDQQRSARDEQRSARDEQRSAARDAGRAFLDGVRATGERGLDTLATLRPGHDRNHAEARASDTTAERVLAATSSAAADGGSAGAPARARAAGFASGAGTLPSWIERLATADGLASARRGTLHLELEPDGLGRIEIRLSFGRDGVRASVLAEHEQTRTLLASQQPQLAAALERNDLRLESFLVDVGVGGDGRTGGEPGERFDEIGLVHVTPEAELDEPALDVRGLVSVRA